MKTGLDNRTFMYAFEMDAACQQSAAATAARMTPGMHSPAEYPMLRAVDMNKTYMKMLVTQTHMHDVVCSGRHAAKTAWQHNTATRYEYGVNYRVSTAAPWHTGMRARARQCYK